MEKKNIAISCMHTVYVACDNRTFETEEECLAWEAKCAELERRKDALFLPTLECCIPCDGTEHMEEHDYTWFFPKSQEDIDALNEYYTYYSCCEENLFDSTDIGKKVCVERCGDCAWTFTEDASVKYAKKLLELLGYTVTIEKQA